MFPPCLSRLSVCCALALYGVATLAADAAAPAVRIVATSPLPGLGIAAEELPYPVRSLSAGALREAQRASLTETLTAQAAAANLNEIQGNPWQADLNFRGFSASPLLGTPQGLSVFLDGVRVNEAFGDTVLWDLLPQEALAGGELIGGSLPVYGLNTLGGALSLRTRDGFAHPGGGLRAEAGAFGRAALSGDFGGGQGPWAAYAAVQTARESGWRDHSPTRIGQAFGKLSHRGDAHDLHLSLLHADNDLTGNGLVPGSMLAQRRESVFSVPDNARHGLDHLALQGGHWLSDSWRLDGTAYFRRSTIRTLNGDANDDFEDDPALDGAAGANGGLGVNQDTGVNNRTVTRQRARGLTLQLQHSGEAGQHTVGASIDEQRSAFRQSAELGRFDADRRVLGGGNETLENELSGRTRTASVYVGSHLQLSPATTLTVSGRYNDTRVTTQDRLNPLPPNLDGDHRYRKFNPALGMTWRTSPVVTAYAGWNQGSRAPTPLELGCADPANPCTLPNALAADPFLEQVITQTLEAGVRGPLTDGGRWRAGGFHSLNRNDILFVGTSTSAGYFTNFGRTRRYGIELEAEGRQGRWTWQGSAAWVRAEYAASACVLAENNSTRGTDPACTGAGQDDEIHLRAGHRIPGIPEFSVKLNLGYRFDDRWELGGELQAFSGQYVRGNENNGHQAGTATDAFGNTRTFTGPGKLAGYALVNLTARLRLDRNLELFGRINNLFDTRYASAGALAENPFSAAGVFQTSADDWTRETFHAPGAPRAAWIGLRYRFGGV